MVKNSSLYNEEKGNKKENILWESLATVGENKHFIPRRPPEPATLQKWER